MARRREWRERKGGGSGPFGTLRNQIRSRDARRRNRASHHDDLGSSRKEKGTERVVRRGKVGRLIGRAGLFREQSKTHRKRNRTLVVLGQKSVRGRTQRMITPDVTTDQNEARESDWGHRMATLGLRGHENPIFEL